MKIKNTERKISLKPIVAAGVLAAFVSFSPLTSEAESLFPGPMPFNITREDKPKLVKKTDEIQAAITVVDEKFYAEYLMEEEEKNKKQDVPNKLIWLALFGGLLTTIYKGFGEIINDTFQSLFPEDKEDHLLDQQ